LNCTAVTDNWDYCLCTESSAGERDSVVVGATAELSGA